MKICRIFIYLFLSAYAFAQASPQATTMPTPRVLSLTLGSENVRVVYLRPGYVSSIRLPEEVSSVVLGDPKGFVAEHSEAEPRLVFFKPVSNKPGETNVLITTKAGHEIPLHLISDEKLQGGEVDFLVDYERPRSFLVSATASSFLVGETKTLEPESSSTPVVVSDTASFIRAELIRQMRVVTPTWEGKQLRVAVGSVTKSGPQTIVAFSVLNGSQSPIELLPPQVQLSGRSKESHVGKAKAELIPIDDYTLTSRRLNPGDRVDGVVVFQRPSFKESTEQLVLDIAQAAEIDRPILIPFGFTALTQGGTQ